MGRILTCCFSPQAGPADTVLTQDCPCPQLAFCILQVFPGHFPCLLSSSRTAGLGQVGKCPVKPAGLRKSPKSASLFHFFTYMKTIRRGWFQFHSPHVAGPCAGLWAATGAVGASPGQLPLLSHHALENSSKKTAASCFHHQPARSTATACSDREGAPQAYLLGIAQV